MTIGFTFDQARCTGCQACILACTIENRLALNHSWRRVYTYNARHHSGQPVSHLSLACNHCEDPACLEACPAGAYSRDRDTGFVQLDERKCIGCRYCTWACPFGAPIFDNSKGIIGKCTFCSERQQAGLEPACVELCPTGALGVETRYGHCERQNVSGFPSSELKPAISITPAGAKRSRPEMLPYAGETSFIPQPGHSDLMRALREEWPLAVFSLMVPILVGILSTSVFSARTPSPAAFLVLSALAAALSLFHLGRKTRAWRAVMNPASSRVSREVLLFGALVGIGTAFLAFAPGSDTAGLLAFATGIAALISIDSVYTTLPLIHPSRYHSASTILTGLLFVGVFSGNPVVAGIVGFAKLLLYLQRKLRFPITEKLSGLAIPTLRVASGFVFPAIAWSIDVSGAFALVISAILVGELIDRLEFYAELDPVTPERQMAIDLQKALSARVHQSRA